ncbi:MAG: FkbM family methyltransferase [Chitinophagales bacterium]|nr:FkbM family methyltransferase [Chitinophagales bacterium]
MREWTYQPGAAAEEHVITVFPGIKMKVNRYNYMGGILYWTGFHHMSEALFLNKYLAPSMTFIDIGANQGELSMIAASIVKNGRVMSFEPVVYQREMLEANKTLNGFDHVEIYPFGLGNQETKLPVYTSDDTKIHHGKNEGLSSLYEYGIRNVYQQDIEIRVFDHLFFDQLDQLDFVKVDVEGAELFALQGMIQTLNKFRPVILIEINEETFNAAGYTTKDVFDFLQKMNYGLYGIKRGVLFPIQMEALKKWGNYIAKPNEK